MPELGQCSRASPTFAAALLLPERGASTTDRATLPIDDELNAALGQRCVGRVRGQSPKKYAVWFEKPQPAAVSNLHLLASLVTETLLLFLSFFCLRLSLEVS